MQRRVVLGSFAASLSMALSACSGGGGPGPGGGGTPPPPPVISFSHTFPAGDAVAQKGTAWDIIGVTTTLSGQFGSAAGQRYDTLRVDTTFAQDVSTALPSAGQPLLSGTQLGVSVLINSDGNPATGSLPACSNAGNITPFEYNSDYGTRLADGNYGVLGPGGPVFGGEATTVFSGHMLSQTFLLSAVGVVAGSSVPQIGIAVSSFNGGDLNSTDCVPSGTAEMYTDIPNLQ